MLAGDEEALPVARIAVGVVGGLAKDGEAAVLFVILHDPVVQDVAAQQIPAFGEVHRPLGPAHARRNLFERAGVDPVIEEAWIEDLDRRLGVALVRLERKGLSKGRFGQPCGGEGRYGTSKQMTAGCLHVLSPYILSWHRVSGRRSRP